MPHFLAIVVGSLCYFFSLAADLRAKAFDFEPVTPWLYRAYQTEDGLPDNSVTGIAQTSDGYLWLATRGGLLRFNGQKFTALPQANLPPLPSRTVRAMFCDSKDQLWLGMERGPLFCLKTDGLQSYTSKEGMVPQRVLMMAEDREGALWIAYPNQLRRLWHGQVQSIELPSEWKGFSDLIMTRDGQGNVWCGRGSHLGIWRDGAWKSSVKFQAPIRAVCAGGQSNLWVAIDDRLYQLNEGQPPLEVARLPARAMPRVMLEDLTGALWIGTASEGLFHWSGQQLEKVPTSHLTIICLYEDREENIWAGTEGGGLNLIRPRTAAFVGRDAGVPFESVRSVTEDADGWLWAASQNGQLARANKGSWQLLNDETNWPGMSVNCVAADPKGGVWVGTSDRGLKFFQNGVWRSWPTSDGLANENIRSLLVALNGDVWIGADSPNQVSRLRAGKFQIITNSTPIGPIRALVQDAAGTVWVGTSEGQIQRVVGATLVPEPAIVEPLPLSVRSLLATGKGHLWIGYAGDGLGHLKDGKYQRLTTADGLLDDFISQLLADDHGNLWINGNRGLSRISLAELEAFLSGRSQRVNPQPYGKLDGLPAMQPSRDYCPSAGQTRDGHLWFALHSGLLVVQPGFVQDNPYEPTVVLERFIVDDQLVATYNSRSPLQPKSATNLLELHNQPAPLRLGPSHGKLEIDFTALSFDSPENIQIRYRMTHFDANWIEAGPSRRATYPRLPAGNYEFQVIACNNSGVWNETGAKLALTVSPFFWETWWFKIGGGLATVIVAAGTAFAISRRRYRQKLQRLEARRALEQERSRIARDIHDDLGATLTRISLLSQPGRSSAEDTETSVVTMAQIFQSARDLTHAMGEVVWAVNPEHDTFDSLANYLSHYAQNFLRAAAIRCRLEMPLDLPKQSLSAEVRHNLFLAFKEALNNVAKHSAASEVRIALTPNESGFELLVADNGKGFSRSSSALNASAENSVRATPGNGLNNMHSRLKEIGGECELRSEPGAGTTILFRVRLKNYHAYA